MTVRTIAALYVDPRGSYMGLPGVEIWDYRRNAKHYEGPHPVVAHPPCGPWSRLKFQCTKQDASCGPRAVAQVQKWGGVLEHPSNSSLFRHCALPPPGAPADAHGGFTLAVRQVSWGHLCAKPTWLYIVGVPIEVAQAGVRTGGEETHKVTNGPRGKQYLPRANAFQIRVTPPAFRDWLIDLARASQKLEICPWPL